MAYIDYDALSAEEEAQLQHENDTWGYGLNEAEFTFSELKERMCPELCVEDFLYDYNEESMFANPDEDDPDAVFVVEPEFELKVLSLGILDDEEIVKHEGIFAFDSLKAGLIEIWRNNNIGIKVAPAEGGFEAVFINPYWFRFACLFAYDDIIVFLRENLRKVNPKV